MLLCIGGVCVPYTAVVPILILCFKWVVNKLAQMGVLPKPVQDFLQVYPTTTTDTTTTSSCEGKDACAKSASAATLSNTGPSLVKTLESEQDFYKSINESDKVICKFTATWCKPCHKIQPFYEQICSSKYNDMKSFAFWTIDVDEYDEIATTYNVAMMPTFIILKGGGDNDNKKNASVLGKYAGSNEHELERFLKEHLES